MRALALTLALASGCATYTVDARTLERARSLDSMQIAIRAQSERDGSVAWLPAARVYVHGMRGNERVRVRVSAVPLIAGLIVLSGGLALDAATIYFGVEPIEPDRQGWQYLGP